MSAVGKYLRRWAHAGRGGYVFYCPGCRSGHTVQTDAPGGWGFNGDLDRPGFEPSVRLSNSGVTLCHLFLRNGVLEFLNDSTAHALRGFVPLPELPDHMKD